MSHAQLFFTLLACSLALPSLLNATKYAKEEISILGDIYSVGLFDLTLNESLYVYQAFGAEQCFRNQSCADLGCPPCNWTDPLVCDGTMRGPNSTCPCLSSLSNVPLVCFPQLYPFATAFWPPGENSTNVNVTNGIGMTVYHPDPPDNCSCILYHLDTLEGNFGALMVWRADTWTVQVRLRFSQQLMSLEGDVSLVEAWDCHYLPLGSNVESNSSYASDISLSLLWKG